MSKRRRKRRGQGGVVFLSERSGVSGTSQSPRSQRESSQASPGHRSTEIAPLERRAPVPISPEALGALTSEMARFNRMLEDLFSRERPGRSPDDRKEMWVLLSALTVVVVFCFVAFYLNQAEVRDMHSDLQSEIDQAGKSAATSMERTIAGLRLERLPEAHASLERFLKEKDRRDGQRIGDLQEEIQRQSEKSGVRFQEDLRGIEGELKALRRLSEEIAKAAAKATPTEVALKDPETKTGWAARAPDGAPAKGPPDPAERPPGQAQAGLDPSSGIGAGKSR